MIINNIGALRAEYRDKKGISKAALARKIGVSRSYITKVEKGQLCPSLDMAFRIAAALLVGIEKVFDREEDRR